MSSSNLPSQSRQDVSLKYWTQSFCQSWLQWAFMCSAQIPHGASQRAHMLDTHQGECPSEWIRLPGQNRLPWHLTHSSKAQLQFRNSTIPVESCRLLPQVGISLMNRKFTIKGVPWASVRVLWDRMRATRISLQTTESLLFMMGPQLAWSILKHNYYNMASWLPGE